MSNHGKVAAALLCGVGIALTAIPASAMPANLALKNAVPGAVENVRWGGWHGGGWHGRGWGWGLGGFAAGAIIGSAIANSAYPAYSVQPGYVAYPAYAAPIPVGCPGGYWARRPLLDQWGNVVGYSRPRFFCP